MIQTNTYIGNLTDEPIIRFTGSGTAVASFTIAMNNKRKDGTDDPAVFLDITAWEELAENAVESLHKGDRVVIVGRLKNANWTNKEGQTVYKTEVTADEISPSLRWAQATVTKSQSKSGRTGQGSQPAGAGAWEAPPATAEVPF